MSLRLRLSRVLLLLAFLAGGGGIPVVDALLYHDANPADSPQGIHLEAPGTACHTDSCLVAFSTVSGADQLRLSPVLPHTDTADLCESPGPLAEPALAPLCGPGLPRSPPLS
jgi:hypothetical protein